MTTRLRSARTKWWLIAVLTFALGACSDDDTPNNPGPGNGPYDLMFTGTVAPHAGQMLHVIVIRTDDGTVAAHGEVTVPGNGSFSFDWPGVLARNASYRIDFYADHNNDGSCDDSPVDHSWRIAVGPVTGNVARDFQHDTNFAEVCDSFEFDLNFTATLAPHAGQTLRAAIVKLGSGGEEVIATAQTTVAAGGGVAINWTDEMEYDHEYVLDFYADHNNNGICDAPPADHAWRLDLGTVRGDVTRDFQHNTSFTGVCSSFLP